MTSHSPLVWRLSLLWQGTLLDTVTLRDDAGVLRLRTGEEVAVVVRGAHLVVGSGDDAIVVAAGESALLPAGHTVVAVVDVPDAVAAHELSIDATWLHSAMVGVAATVCVFSALWLAPLERLDDAGAGLPSTTRLWLSMPGGTARTAGRPTLAVPGRPPEEAERVTTERAAGAPLSREPGPAPSFERTLAAMSDALRRPLGAAGSDVRDPLGEATRAIAAAPVLGAGMGGLTPRDPVDAGAGNGVIGAGNSVQLARLLRRSEQKLEQRAPENLPPKQTYKAKLVDIPDADIDDQHLTARPELDPVVREQLMINIRTRHNVLRGCYESWGLSADRKTSGRVVVELTLRPDGHVDDVATTGTDGLRLVAECVTRAARDWYLGDGLVEQPTRLSFPFVLRPRE
jgi:hypothetical protein